MPVDIGRDESSSSSKPFSLFGFYDQKWPEIFREMLASQVEGRLKSGALTPMGFSDQASQGYRTKLWGEQAAGEQGRSQRLAESLTQRGLSGSGVDVQSQLQQSAQFGQERAGIGRDIMLAEEGQRREDIDRYLKTLEVILGPAGTESKSKSSGWNVGIPTPWG